MPAAGHHNWLLLRRRDERHWLSCVEDTGFQVATWVTWRVASESDSFSRSLVAPGMIA